MYIIIISETDGVAQRKARILCSSGRRTCACVFEYRVSGVAQQPGWMAMPIVQHRGPRFPSSVFNYFYRKCYFNMQCSKMM